MPKFHPSESVPTFLQKSSGIEELPVTYRQRKVKLVQLRENEVIEIKWSCHPAKPIDPKKSDCWYCGHPISEGEEPVGIPLRMERNSKGHPVVAIIQYPCCMVPCAKSYLHKYLKSELSAREFEMRCTNFISYIWCKFPWTRKLKSIPMALPRSELIKFGGNMDYKTFREESFKVLSWETQNVAPTCIKTNRKTKKQPNTTPLDEKWVSVSYTVEKVEPFGSVNVSDSIKSTGIYPPKKKRRLDAYSTKPRNFMTVAKENPKIQRKDKKECDETGSSLSSFFDD